MAKEKEITKLAKTLGKDIVEEYEEIIKEAEEVEQSIIVSAPFREPKSKVEEPKEIIVKEPFKEPERIIKKIVVKKPFKFNKENK